MLVEIVVCSADDAVAAERGGAHRLELCAAIELGGLTPSVGSLLATKRHCGLPVISMVRPRGAGFAYSAVEFETMQEDVWTLVEAGTDGIVTGVLQENGQIDAARAGALRMMFPSVPFVFHRAFDATPDPFRSLDVLIELGYTRVLTSGQRARGTEAVELLKQLHEHADGRIEILPAGGLRSTNVAEFVQQTGLDQVHQAPFELLPDLSTSGRREIVYGMTELADEGSYRRTDADEVRRVVEAATYPAP